MQEVWAGSGATATRVVLPDADAECIEGVRWGSPDYLNTPAYWAVRCRWGDEVVPDFVSKTASLAEEIGFCVLGGYGVTYEVNAAAFEHLKSHGVFDLAAEISEDEIRELLGVPLDVDGRSRRYRFPNQRAKRLSSMRRRLSSAGSVVTDARGLRDHLMGFDGIGPKTASWIVRNHLGSDEVAIIDVHVIRACRGMSVFPQGISLPRDYGVLEDRFLDFARAIDIRPSVLDAVIWTEMRQGRQP